MIVVRPARPADAPAIAAVHVAAWRSAYAGILSAPYLAGLSVARQAAYYASVIRSGAGVHVACTPGSGNAPRVVGFATGHLAIPSRGGDALGDGEIDTLYVLDDFRDNGIGRALMGASAKHLSRAGCRSAFLWVLADNPSRWFYRRLHGRPVLEGHTLVAGQTVAQTAYAWSPIATLIAAAQVSS